MSRILFAIAILLTGCTNSCSTNNSTQSSNKHMETDTKHKHTNALVNETSPYLLQHAHNPVNWHPWGDVALQKARDENKLLLISIGYSACHWCHVMERESFEDSLVASVMNDNFVCIKVDREERPDIDQIYMTAVQLMTGSGGWPLNCIALPDGRPIFGGTYFPKEKWMETIQNISDIYVKEPEKAMEYATQLTNGVKQAELVTLNTSADKFDVQTLHSLYENWAKSFDHKNGGPNRSPKFPIPNNYQYLLRYNQLTKKKDLEKYLNTTLDRIALGGIYDHVGGGFARYSTDVIWKVPHFEKMLYDNAQLVSLYSEAYLINNKQLYKDVVYETCAFVKREMMDKSGAFYSAYDADSEGEEGKFYVWTEDELKNLLGESFDVFADYYNVNDYGFWEHGNYILIRKDNVEKIKKKHSLSDEALKEKIDNAKQVLYKEREKRIKPGLDDKSLTSWNALMCKGFADAYSTFEEQEFLDLAITNANFIVNTQLQKDGSLLHSYKNGKSTINGFLEDYAFTIEAFIRLYEITFDDKWLNRASDLMAYTITHFKDEETQMFYFTSDVDTKLIARKMELNDNVIPASNSSIANSLFLLGHHFDKAEYQKQSMQMLRNVMAQMPSYGPGYSNWAMLLLNQVQPFYEIAISGKNANGLRSELSKNYIPNKMYSGSTEDSNLPLLEYRFNKDETLIYVCVNKACKIPVDNVKDALVLLK